MGYEEAHKLHSAKCSCNLPLNKHKNSCKSLISFKKFLQDWKDPNKVAKQEKDEFGFGFDSDFDSDTMIPMDSNFYGNIDDIVMCCCRPEAPHDESIKFMLKEGCTLFISRVYHYEKDTETIVYEEYKSENHDEEAGKYFDRLGLLHRKILVTNNKIKKEHAPSKYKKKDEELCKELKDRAREDKVLEKDCEIKLFGDRNTGDLV